MYSKEQLELLETCLGDATLLSEDLNPYGKNYTSSFKINRVYVDEGKLIVNLHSNQNRTRTVRLKNLLESLGDGYKTRDKFILGLRDYVRKSDLKFGPAVRKYLEDGVIKLEEVKVEQNEIDWLKAHTKTIEASVPMKYEKVFRKVFPGQTFTTKKQWSFAFYMTFDEVEDMPESLLNLKNKEGNSVDLKRKQLNNTSYIWRLVKDYPDLFAFGAR